MLTPPTTTPPQGAIPPTTPLPVPAYGSTFYNPSTGQAAGTNQYDPNTGMPLHAPGNQPPAPPAVTPPPAPTTTPPPATTTPPASSTDTNSNGYQPVSNQVDNSANQNTIDTAHGQQNALNTQLDNAYNTFSNTMNGYTNGTIPLTAGEQAQVDGLKAQYQQLIDQQKLVNTGASGLANVRGYQGGAAEYDPTFQAKTIGSIVSAGQAKIADLNTKMAQGVAQLTQALQANDIANIKSAYDAYTAYAKQKSDVLQKTIDDTQTAMKQAQDEADKQQQYSLDVAKFNNDIKNTAFTQALDTKKFDETVKSDEFDRAYKMEDLQLKKQANSIASQQNNLPVVPTTPTGAPDKQSQDNFLASLPGGATGALATGIKGLASYTILPTTFSTRSVGGAPSQRQQFITLAKQYDPTYDENLAPARAQNLKDLNSLKAGTIGFQKSSLNTAVNHLASYVDIMSKLPNGPVGFLNSFDNNAGVLNKTLQKNKAQAESDAEGFGTEYAKYLVGGSPDVKSIEEQRKGLSSSNSPSATKGNAQSKIDLLTGKLSSLASQQTTAMGKPVEAVDLLDDASKNSLSKLKNQGYTVDIPGILYTDPKAYIAHEPNAADNLRRVISAYPQLSQEDALQLAQSLDQ